MFIKKFGSYNILERIKESIEGDKYYSLSSQDDYSNLDCEKFTSYEVDSIKGFCDSTHKVSLNL